MHPFTAIYRRVPEGYVGYVAELPGAHTQATTLDEARSSLREAATLVLEASLELSELEIAGADAIREPLELLV